jgi:hypothetical protein
VTEPTTALTDWLLAVVAAVLGGLLFQAGGRERVAARAFWGFSLLALGVAAAVGGTYHALRGEFAAETLAAIWKLTIYGLDPLVGRGDAGGRCRSTQRAPSLSRAEHDAA